MNKIVKLLAAFAVLAALAGCARTGHIANISSTVGTGHTEAQVKSAILKAGVQRDWIMNEAGPGVIKARQQNRQHVAEVRINYSASSYTISYVSSQGLRANGSKIHRSYNRWVNNLDKDIQINLTRASAQ